MGVPKHRRAASLCFLVASWVLISCGGSEPDLTWQRIQEQGVLRVGMDPNWVPFEYVDGAGQLVGFDVELARELGQRLGFNVDLVANLGFDGLYDALTAGQVDVIVSAMVVDGSRRADYDFSIPYFDAGQVLVIGPGAAGVSTVGDLRNGVLAVELGSGGDTVARSWARRLPSLSIIHAESAQDALAAAMDGRADAALTDRATALIFLAAHQREADPEPQSNGSQGLRISDEPVTREQYAVVVRKDSSALLDAINVCLNDMQREGILQELQKKWLGP